MTVAICQSLLRDISEELRPDLHHSQSLKSYMHIHIQVLAWGPALLTDVFLYFPQALQSDVMILPQFMPRPCPFECHIH